MVALVLLLLSMILGAHVHPCFHVPDIVARRVTLGTHGFATQRVTDTSSRLRAHTSRLAQADEKPRGQALAAVPVVGASKSGRVDICEVGTSRFRFCSVCDRVVYINPLIHL